MKKTITTLSILFAITASIGAFYQWNPFLISACALAAALTPLILKESKNDD
ncbi:hypothetical protein [Alloscardovia macacae]|uniref:Uncharacterized protein n=1 Tax=Alloscardovia macacae TaxID=1160091 RepID=A0A261F4S0_9BIFI|nr:hypothetical protein [Alloscardovia macacae]OZG54137.1 hypothetical protein ALMA_0598 [Alloscardovia macacae]